MIDSRLVKPGALFFALKGTHFDGHDFLEKVFQNGARGAVVAKSYSGSSFGMELFHVESPFHALQELARRKQQERKALIIAVTGSVGKTTTKEFVAHLLSAKYKVGKSPGNANSQLGIPLTILNELKGDEEIVIFEMGMTHSGNIKRLVEIAPPDIAIITAVELVHAANFDSLAQIAAAKGEILSQQKTQLAVLNRKLKKHAFSSPNVLYYSREDVRFSNHLPTHLQENLGAAIVLSRYLGVSDVQIVDRINSLQTFEKRFQIELKGGIHIVNDAYNASEPSMIAALQNLPSVKGTRIAILGEMLELGAFSEECHKRVGQAALESVDEVYLVGEGCRPILNQFLESGKKAVLYKDKSDLLKQFQEIKPRLKEGDLVLLKGSRHWGLCALAEEIA